MSRFLENGGRNFRLADALDILVATILLTLLFHWLRKRSTRAMILTIATTIALYVVSHVLRMYLTLALFRTGLLVVLFALIVVFQSDLRLGFERLAAWRPLRQRGHQGGHQNFLETLTQSVSLLAEEKIGALIVLPARESLARHLRGGVTVDGQLSLPLLHSIFHSASLGHDGAVILRGDRVALLGVHLPLSKNLEALGAGGTRHAAGLGLAERSDALVIVVSEERGTISLAQHGELETLSHPRELQHRLEEFHKGRAHQKPGLRILRRLTTSGALTLLAFAGAVLLWYQVANRVESVQRLVDEVPIESRNVGPDWVVESIQPETVQMTVSGSERAFNAFAWENLKVTLDLTELQDGPQPLRLSEDSVSLPEEMRLERIEPNSVWVTAYQMRLVEVPVRLVTRGRLPEGFQLKAALPARPQVRARVRESLWTPQLEIPTEPVDLTNLKTPTTRTVRLQPPRGVLLADETPDSLEVTLDVQPIRGQGTSDKGQEPEASPDR